MTDIIVVLKENEDVATLRNIDHHSIIKVSKTEKGLILLANEARWLHHLNFSGFTPRLLMDEPGRIVMQDLGDSQEVQDSNYFRRQAIQTLLWLRLARVKHGDLTASNVIIRNDRPWLIDWGEAVALHGSLPSKRPEPDATHLWGVVAANNDTTRIARRWLAIREAIGVDTLGSKSLLDLGCYEGDFVAAAGVEGMTGCGIDQDRDAIVRAQNLWSDVSSVGFSYYNIVDFLSDTIAHFHAGLLLSVFPYLVKGYGEKEALEILAAIKAKCEVLFFESQLVDDGPGPAFLGHKGDVSKMLSDLPGVTKVEEIITLPVAGRDAERTVFMVK